MDKLIIKNRKIELEKIYIILSLIFGVLFIFSNGPFQSPDEYTHFRRAYQISDGYFLGQSLNNERGAFIPKSINDTVIKVSGDVPMHPDKKIDIKSLLRALSMPLDIKNKFFIASPNTLIYTPIVYIPQSIGIFIGKTLNLSPLILMYLGRIFNLIFSSIIIFFSMKIIRNKKNLLFLFALMPMLLYQSASLSADGVTNSIAIFTISYFVAMFGNKVKYIKKNNIILMIVLVCVLSLTKEIYILFSLLYFFIPRSKFKSKKQYVTTALIIILLPFILNLIWLLLTTTTLATNANVSVSGQIKFILHNPILYLKIILKTFMENGSFYFRSFIGILGWLDTNFPIPVYITYYVFLILSSVVNNKNVMFNFKRRIYMIVLFLIMIIIIFTSLYVSYTQVGNPDIQGVQGRYFIPIALLLLLPLESLKVKIKNFNLISVIYVVCILSFSVYALINRYFIT